MYSKKRGARSPRAFEIAGWCVDTLVAPGLIFGVGQVLGGLRDGEAERSRGPGFDLRSAVRQVKAAHWSDAGRVG